MDQFFNLVSNRLLIVLGSCDDLSNPPPPAIQTTVLIFMCSNWHATSSCAFSFHSFGPSSNVLPFPGELAKTGSRGTFLSDHLKASPLPPAPSAVAGLLVAGLAAWQYSDPLAGLLACWLVGFCVLAFVLPVLSIGVFAGSWVSGC